MKRFLLFGTALLAASATAQAQNTATVTQSGTSHEVSVVQEGKGNTSVISQGQSSQGNTNGNRAVITQSGGGNVATINQGGSDSTKPGQSVSVSQSGDSETVINQNDGTNSISIYQGPAKAEAARDTPANGTKKRGSRRKPKSGQ